MKIREQPVKLLGERGGRLLFFLFLFATRLKEKMSSKVPKGANNK